MKLDEPLQSAYNPFHLTESALLCVHNDIFMQKDRCKVILLALLDLSAAFDTVNHDILIHRLKHDNGIEDSALDWFQSYLHDGDQRICISNAMSTPTILDIGVP